MSICSASIRGDPGSNAGAVRIFCSLLWMSGFTQASWGQFKWLLWCDKQLVAAVQDGFSNNVWMERNWKKKKHLVMVMLSSTKKWWHNNTMKAYYLKLNKTLKKKKSHWRQNIKFTFTGLQPKSPLTRSTMLSHIHTGCTKKTDHFCFFNNSEKVKDKQLKISVNLTNNI